MPGIKIEEVSCGERYSGRLWFEMARQLYCENGREEYREIGHFSDGAPFLYGDNSRISITHCPGLLAVATLPPTPEVNLEGFTQRAALGIDAERRDREQVLRVRDKYLSAADRALVPADDLGANVLAWTVKEAVYKAALQPGLDFAEDIRIVRLPKLGPATPVFNPADYGLDPSLKAWPAECYGEVEATLASGPVLFQIYSYLSDDFVVTLAFTPKTAKFAKKS